MNDLSWILVYISLMESAATLFGLTAFVMGSFAIAHSIFAFTYNIVEKPKDPQKYLPVPFYLVTALVVIIYVFFPSTQTLYLIAGSEVAEMAMTSQQTQDVLNDIRAVIQSYTNPTTNH